MTVLLNRSYQNFASGSIVELPASTESALIAQGIAASNAGPVTTGAYSTQEYAGTAAVAAGQGNVVITHPLVTASSKIMAVVSQAAADGTALRVERVVPAAGSFTIYLTANATATTNIDWVFPSSGMTPNQ